MRLAWGFLQDLWRPQPKAPNLHLLYILLYSRKDLRVLRLLRPVESWRAGVGNFEQAGAAGPEQWLLFSSLGDEV